MTTYTDSDKEILRSVICHSLGLNALCRSSLLTYCINDLLISRQSRNLSFNLFFWRLMASGRAFTS